MVYQIKNNQKEFEDLIDTYINCLQDSELGVEDLELLKKFKINNTNDIVEEL